tara:strand:- start:233 stop:628 length:396 start_codon:yes stop_codon:yes gene_type:complete
VKSEVVVGQAGEYLVASVFFEMGVQCVVAPTMGFDLVAFDGGKTYRVEVKTASKNYAIKKSLYSFSTSRGSKSKKRISVESCDVLALVALPLRRVFFINSASLTGKNKRLSQSRFVQGCEEESWREATTWT